LIHSLYLILLFVSNIFTGLSDKLYLARLKRKPQESVQARENVAVGAIQPDPNVHEPPSRKGPPPRRPAINWPDDLLIKDKHQALRQGSEVHSDSNPSTEASDVNCGLASLFDSGISPPGMIGFGRYLHFADADPEWCEEFILKNIGNFSGIITEGIDELAAFPDWHKCHKPPKLTRVEFSGASLNADLESLKHPGTAKGRQRVVHFPDELPAKNPHLGPSNHFLPSKTPIPRQNASMQVGGEDAIESYSPCICDIAPARHQLRQANSPLSKTLVCNGVETKLVPDIIYKFL
jgi:hypothetical protein